MEDTVGVGDLLVGWGGDGAEVGGYIPSKEVLCFGEAALGGEFIAAEGARIGDGLVGCDRAPDKESREGGGGLVAVENLGGIEGDRGLIVNESVKRGEDRGLVPLGGERRGSRWMGGYGVG